MSNKMFMRVEDVAEEMGVSVSYASKMTTGASFSMALAMESR